MTTVNHLPAQADATARPIPVVRQPVRVVSPYQPYCRMQEVLPDYQLFNGAQFAGIMTAGCKGYLQYTVTSAGAGPSLSAVTRTLPAGLSLVRRISIALP